MSPLLHTMSPDYLVLPLCSTSDLAPVFVILFFCFTSLILGHSYVTNPSDNCRKWVVDSLAAICRDTDPVFLRRVDYYWCDFMRLDSYLIYGSIVACWQTLWRAGGADYKSMARYLIGHKRFVIPGCHGVVLRSAPQIERSRFHSGTGRLWGQVTFPSIQLVPCLSNPSLRCLVSDFFLILWPLISDRMYR